VWLAPLSVATNTRAALAISAMMIIAWMTEVMEYASAGLVGLLPVLDFRHRQAGVIFSGFVNDASWFYIGAVFLGTMATKTACRPHRGLCRQPRRPDLFAPAPRPDHHRLPADLHRALRASRAS
jgi:hypothetical protein